MKLIEIQRHYFRLQGEPDNNYFCTKADTDIDLNVKRVWYVPVNNSMQIISDDAQFLVGADLAKIRPLESTLGMAYTPASDIHRLNTNTPDSMAYDIHEALNKLKESVGNVTDFVCERLQWSRDEIEERLFAEQVDAVALCIYNFEARNQSMIIGDQTGIGKGRIASCIIRYAIVHGYIPVYCTEKANLFTDNYRDLSDIGCGDLKPFIINNGTDAKITKYDPDLDKDVVVYSPLSIDFKEKHLKTFDKNGEGSMPIDPVTGREFDYILTTYSQLNKSYKNEGSEQGPDFYKLKWLESIAKYCIYIFDESHNIAGSKSVVKQWWSPSKAHEELTGSNIFMAFGLLARSCHNALFLSATYAKKPENLVIYSQRSCIKDAELGNVSLINTIKQGGEALQEIISAAIVKEGQMIRRESNFSGIETNYIHLNAKEGPLYNLPDLEAEHRAKCDFITRIINKMNDFEAEHIQPLFGQYNYGTQSADVSDKNLGAHHTPIFSKLHQIVAQLLYAIKAPAVAQHAINLLNEGKKVVIAVANTMGAQFDSYNDGDVIEKCDFSQVLQQGLDKMFDYTIEDDEDHSKTKEQFTIEDLSEEGKKAYLDLRDEIRDASSGITLSPIDLIIQKIQKAKFRVGEVTGRKRIIELTNEEGTKGIVRDKSAKSNDEKLKKEKKNILFSKFQNNKLDVLIINVAGSTGASAHATTKNTNLKPSEVKPRVMIIAQPELDINIEVQKRGRINRTGQIANLPPRYDYLISAIPAETRLMMILQKKMRSLDANTTSNQKQSTGIIDVPDFINIIGDEVCEAYLTEHPEVKKKLNMDESGEDEKEGSRENKKVKSGLIKKVTGYVPVLACEEQEDFYNSIQEGYEQLVNDLKIRGEYNLEVENVDLDARLIGKPEILIPAKLGKSTFADAVYQAKFDCKNLNKPYNRSTIEVMIKDYLQGRDAKEIASELSDKLNANFAPGIGLIAQKFAQRMGDEMQRYQKKKAKIEADDSKDEADKRELIEQCDINLKKALDEMRKKQEAEKDRKTRELKRRHYVDFFYAGRACLIDRVENIRGICLGTKINNKKEHGFTLSNVIVMFAVADSRKRLELNLSDKDVKELDAIMMATQLLDDNGLDLDKTYLEDWNNAVKELSTDRETRTIILGNILIGYDKALKLTNEAKEEGSIGRAKLISFTTANKEVMKGVLMPRESNLKSTTFVGLYDIQKMMPIFKNILASKSQEEFNLSGGLTLTFNHNSDIELLIKTKKMFNKLSKDVNVFTEFQRLDNRQRTFTEEKNGYLFETDKSNLDDLVNLLKAEEFNVELTPQESEIYFPANKNIKKTSWSKLDVDRSEIPPNTSLMQLECEFL